METKHERAPIQVSKVDRGAILRAPEHADLLAVMATARDAPIFAAVLIPHTASPGARASTARAVALRWAVEDVVFLDEKTAKMIWQRQSRFLPLAQAEGSPVS